MSTSSNATDVSVRAERIGVALVITICRPHAGNSIDLATANAIGDALEAACEDAAVRAVIITGEGDRFFCTGGDLKAYRSLDTASELANTFGRVRELLDAFEALPLPVIAAIDGYALGGGLELALACDLRFAAAHAKLGFPQAKLGLIPGWNGGERLVELVGKGQALHLLYTGEPLSAEQALQIGLVEATSNSQRALEYALAYTEKLAAVGPLALSVAKATTLSALRAPRIATRALADAEFARLWFTADHREAEAAFAEKRPPRFQGN